MSAHLIADIARINDEESYSRYRREVSKAGLRQTSTLTKMIIVDGLDTHPAEAS